MDVVVVGAGVFGAATALELARRGARVTHVERERPGAGTSSRGAGLVAEGMWHPTSLRLVARSIEIFERMSREGEELAHPFRFHQTGSTTLIPPRLAAAARALAKKQRDLGVPVREVEPNDLRGLRHHEQMRVDDVAVGLHYEHDGWGLPRLFAEVCSLQAQTLGVVHVRGEARLRRLPGGVRVEVEGREPIGADAIVVAGGVWTRAFLRSGDLDAPLQAYRTQAMRLTRLDADKVPILHDAVQGFYLRPGIPQHLVAGNGTTTTPEDLARWEAEGDAAFIESTRRRLAHRFPWLADVPAGVEAWAGIEAATPDRLLFAGPHPDDARVWLLAGGNGHGFMRAPAAAESLAQHLLGHAPTIDLSAYAPGRFKHMSQAFDIREGFSLEEPALM